MKNKIRYMGGIISQSSAVDQNTQSLSVFNVIDEITVDLKSNNSSQPIPVNATGKVVIPLNFQVITLWKRNNLSDQAKDVACKLEVEIVDPLGESLGKNAIDIPIPSGKKRSRYILTINGMPVTITGEYLVQFKEVGDNGEKSDILASLVLDMVVNRS